MQTDTIQIEEVVSFLETAPIRIAVFGEFSAGKTTFLNALIGEDLLSVAVDPTTAVPTRVRYGREFNIFVELTGSTDGGETKRLFEDDPPFWTRFVGRGSALNTLRKEKGQIRSFLKAWTKEGERADEVERVVVELPLDWLKSGLELVDTPGANNEFTRHQGFTRQEAEAADIAVMLMDVRQGGGKRSEFDFMNEVGRSATRSFVALNKMDLIDADEREEATEYVAEEALPKHWDGPTPPPVVGLSALVALAPEEHDEPELAEAFRGFVGRIERLAEEERGKILLGRVGNPEQKLYGRARSLESQDRHDRAHRTWFELLDVLEAAGMDTQPATDGIARCEEALTGQVEALDRLHARYEDALELEAEDPDEALELLRMVQGEMQDLGTPDADVNKAARRLTERIERRDAERQEIESLEEKALKRMGEDEPVKASAVAAQIEDHLEEAELPPARYESVRELMRDCADGRDEWANIHKKRVHEALKIEEKNPQEALDTLRSVAKSVNKLYRWKGGTPGVRHQIRMTANEVSECVETGYTTGTNELKASIARIHNRVRQHEESRKRRDEARRTIAGAVQRAKGYRDSERYIEAASAAEKIPPLLDTAGEERREELERFVEKQQRQRDAWARERWETLSSQAREHLEANDFQAAAKLVEPIKTVRPFLSEKTEARQLVTKIEERFGAYQSYESESKEATEACRRVLSRDRVNVEEAKPLCERVAALAARYEDLYDPKGDPPALPSLDDDAPCLTIGEKLAITALLRSAAEEARSAAQAKKLARQLKERESNIEAVTPSSGKPAKNVRQLKSYPDHPAFVEQLTRLLSSTPAWWATPSSYSKRIALIEEHKPSGSSKEKFEQKVEELTAARQRFTDLFMSVGVVVAMLVALAAILFVENRQRKTPSSSNEKSQVEEARGSGTVSARSSPNNTGRNLTSKLVEASADGDVREVRRLIAKGADPDARNDRGVTVLSKAAYDGQSRIVSALLGGGADPDVGNEEDEGALSGALYGGHAGIARLLLESGADPNATYENNPAILKAASEGYNEVVEALLDAGASPDADNGDGLTPLMAASFRGHDEIVSALLQRGANPDAEVKSGQSVVIGSTALTAAAAQGHERIVRSLLEAGADPSPVVESENTPLALAGRNGHSGVVRLLRQADVKPSLRARQDLSEKLISAAGRGNLQEARRLLSIGADPNMANRNQVTPLIRAAYGGHGEIVRALLDAGANPDAMREGRTARMWAISENHDEIVTLLRNAADARREEAKKLSNAMRDGCKIERIRQLLENGVHPDARASKLSMTALMKASREGNSECVRLLLEAGASSNTVLNLGTEGYIADTPLMIGAESGAVEVVRLLLQNGADPNARNSFRLTPLMYAAMEKHLDIASLLLKAGANPNSKDDNGRTALAIAMKENYSAIARLLKESGASEEAANSYLTQIEFLEASRRGDIGKVRRLLDAGVDPSLGTLRGDPAIILAVKQGHISIVRLLLEEGADPNARGNPGGDSDTPLGAAEYGGHTRIADLLRESGARE